MIQDMPGPRFPAPHHQAREPPLKKKGNQILKKKDGGGSRTRTCEGIASGFTVRPLCRSGHSPACALIGSRSRGPPVCRFCDDRQARPDLW